MPSWSGAGKGAITGATAGAAFGPWGALIGGAAGGIIGGLSGSDAPAAPQIADVGYGGVNGNAGKAFGQSEAQRVIDEQWYRSNQDRLRGESALARGQALGGQAQRAAFNGQVAAANNQSGAIGMQRQAIGAAGRAGAMADADRQAQQEALGRLRGFYESGPGPSVAEAQMRAGQDANMAQSIALARSGRGAGANANAMRNAAFSNAASGQQLNQQLGVLRAQENEAFQQRRLAAMGLEQGTIGGMRGQDIGQQGQHYGFASQMGAQGLGYGQLGAQYQQIGNQAQLGFEGMGNQTNLGFAGLENQSNQFGETMRNKIFNDTANLNFQSQIANANLAAGHAANEQRQSAADQAYVGSMLATAAPMVSGWGKSGGGANPTPSESNPWSEARAKKNIQPTDGYVSSPVEAKRDIRPVDAFGAPPEYQRAWNGVSMRDSMEPPQAQPAFSMSAPPIRPGVDLRPAEGFSYEYKDPGAPGAAPGRHVGPMVEGLEQTPAGKSVVRQGPDGKKQVDTSRLALVNTAAISELQRRTDELQALLDSAYARQGRDTGPRASLQSQAFGR